jgi:transglutaminase-like putative cysteine protease
VQAGTNSNPVTITEVPLAEGADGTFQSLDAMAAAVRGEIPPDFSGYQDEANRRAVEQIVSRVAGQDARGEIDACFRFVRDHLTYRNHPLNQQRVQDCQRTLQLGSGDCVSKSVCLATLLACLGYEVRFVAQCPDGQDYSHVYVEARDDQTGEWIALDPVAEDEPMGWFQRLPDGGFETTWPIF